MVNPERGEARLEVDGTGYVLKLTMQHAIELQHNKNKPLGVLFDAINNLDIDAIAGVLWASLQVHHPRQFKTEASVVEMMEKAGGLGALPLFLDAVTELIRANNKNGASGEADPLPAQAGGIVESSTSTPEASG